MDVATKAEIDLRISMARARYGELASTHEALGVACEEWDEFRAAIHQNDMSAVQKEALDLAAILIRLAEQLHSGDQRLIQRSTK